MAIIPDISICTVTRNRMADLKKFLRCMYDASDPVSIEIIIVDNHSTDDTKEMISADFPEVKVFELDKPYPFATAINHALQIAGGRYISIWDQSITINTNCLFELVAHLDNNPDVGIIGPRINDPKGQLIPSAGLNNRVSEIIKYTTEIIFSGQFKKPLPGLGWDHAKEKEVNWLSTDCMIIQGEVIKETGLLGINYLSVFADLDYCLRARADNWHLFFINTVKITKNCPDSISKNWKQPPLLPKKYQKNRWFELLNDVIRIILKIIFSWKKYF
jgi:GT2 family glycosyltransferase